MKSWKDDVSDSEQEDNQVETEPDVSEPEEEQQSQETDETHTGTQTVSEAVPDQDERQPPEPSETSEEASEPPKNESGPEPPSFDGVTVGEAAKAQQNRRWKLLVWGPPKTFKTHFCYTMPEPVAIIDTEGKSDDLAKKFTDKDVRIWNPHEMEAEPQTKFRAAKKALEQAFEWLDWYQEHEGKVGSICVDSMSDMWEWAQEHYKVMDVPGKKPEDVELSAGFQKGGKNPWMDIKRYHNGEFRDIIAQSDYHFCWTSQEQADVEESIGDDDNRKFLKPRGENYNDYKVDTIIQSRNDKDQGKVGDLTGSNFVDHSFIGLHKPTFDKVKKTIERMEQVEAGGVQMTTTQLADELDCEAIIEGNPQVYLQR